jgi:hypothetical protein
LKIALDENLPTAIVKMLAGLAKEDDSQGVTLVNAKKYRPIDERGDGNWVRRFARARGSVVVTGDTKIRGNLHEQAAFFQAGMITFFFEGAWSQLPLHSKAAMLMVWWPAIVAKAKDSNPGDFWEIPFGWNVREMRFVRPPEAAIAKHRDPKSAGRIPPSRQQRTPLITQAVHDAKAPSDGK